MRSAFVLLFAACSSSTSTSTQESELLAENQLPDMASACPMTVDGATVAVNDAGGGVAMIYTTEEGDVEDLRARVENLAEAHTRGKMMPMADAEVRAEDVEGGAQLIFIPVSPEQVETMRVYVQRAALELESGDCEMVATAE